MKAIFLNVTDFILYQTYVRSMNFLGRIARYKIEILCTLIIFGLVYLMATAFGVEEITKEFSYSFTLDQL